MCLKAKWHIKVGLCVLHKTLVEIGGSVLSFDVVAKM